MNYFVYILKSTFKNWYYIGFTSNLEKRLLQHNFGSVKSTKFYKPLSLVFAQIVKNTHDARDLEKFLKVRFNKEALLQLIL